MGVSFDSPEENLAFAKKFSFNFPLLCDTGKSMGVSYGAASDAQARNASRVGVVLDPSSKVIFWADKVDAKKFPEEALAIIRQHKA